MGKIAVPELGKGFDLKNATLKIYNAAGQSTQFFYGDRTAAMTLNPRVKYELTDVDLTKGWVINGYSSSDPYVSVDFKDGIVYIARTNDRDRPAHEYWD